MATNSGDTNSSIPNSTAPIPERSAAQILQEFLNTNNMELRLTPPAIRQVEGGAVQIEQPQIVVQFKTTDSIAKN